MPTWKFVISDPETRKSGQKEVDQSKTVNLLGKKIGDEFSGDALDMHGYTLKITGGTDKDGFPMIPNVEGMGRRRVLLTGVPGFHPKIKGQRKRKTVRGNTISADIMQINCKVVKKGTKSFGEMFPKKEKTEKKAEEPKKEEKKEKPKEEKKEEKKVEEKEIEKEAVEVKEESSGGEEIQSQS
jgi:small subunit ribosomal protein S6e